MKDIRTAIAAFLAVLGCVAVSASADDTNGPRELTLPHNLRSTLAEERAHKLESPGEDEAALESTAVQRERRLPSRTADDDAVLESSAVRGERRLGEDTEPALTTPLVLRVQRRMGKLSARCLRSTFKRNRRLGER